MTVSCRSAVALVLLLMGSGADLRAQVTGSLGLSGSIIEYDGFLSSTSGILTPSLRYDAKTFSAAAQGSWTFFESGTSVVQGNLAAGWLAGRSRWWRLELSGSAGASRYHTDPTTSHVLGGVRFHAFGQSSGAWLGGSIGRTDATRVRNPVEVSAAAWTVRQRVALVASVTGSGIGADRYLDLAGAVRWTGTRLELEGRLGARPWSDTRGAIGDAVTGLFVEATARVPIGERIALSLGAGTYPTDPVRQVLGARYLNAGVRLQAFGRSPATNPVFEEAVLRRRPIPEGSAPARLEIGSSGETRKIRVIAPGAASVELMADFTDWEPVRLRRTGSAWEVTLAVPAGVHRLNVRLDGGRWVVPRGARPEATDFEGEVGIVVLP